MVARLSSSPFPFLRVGLVVPRYGHTAVDRNRLKRRLREIIRQHLSDFNTVGDLVFWIRPAAYAASFEDLQLALERLRDRIDAQADQIPEA
jgi:ribonuclease P protein component